MINIPLEEIEIARATQEDHWNFLNFLQTSDPDSWWSKEFMEWQYYLNPAGIAKSWVAKHRGDVVANYTAIPHQLSVKGKRELSWRVQDVITHPNYRGIGLYSQLSNLANQFLKSNNFPINFTFPNENSHHGFMKQNWLNPNRIPLWLLPKPQEIPALKMTLQVEPLLKFTQTDEAIWNSFSDKLYFCVERSVHYLNWRYFKNPRGKYFPFRLADGTKSAICIFKIYENGCGDKFAHLMDCFYEDGFKQKAELIRFFIHFSQKQGVQLASAWSQPKSIIAHQLQQYGFKLNQNITRWFVLNLNSPVLHQDEVCDFGNWHISMGDTDVF